MTQAYKKLFTDTSDSVPAVNTLRGSFMYVFLIHNKNLFLTAYFVNRSPGVTFGIALIKVTAEGED